MQEDDQQQMQEDDMVQVQTCFGFRCANLRSNLAANPYLTPAPVNHASPRKEFIADMEMDATDGGGVPPHDAEALAPAAMLSGLVHTSRRRRVSDDDGLCESGVCGREHL